jgi:signal peptidase I
MSKTKATAAGRSPARNSPSGESYAPRGRALRETVESIAVAVILAFLFRAFVAEAFVIPTGSMAPTLMGQHKDVQCPECGYWYQAGASIEIEDEPNPQRMMEGWRVQPKGVVVAATCPLCRYRQILDLKGDANQKTFSGDRILVSKFIYDFASPERWDVIVFKYPFNAKQNFIKRLVGLPNETILIKRGDVFVKQPGEDDFTIARKPDRKLDAMLQLVDDTKHISRTLTQVGWPLRWQGWVPGGRDVGDAWTTPDAGHTYATDGFREKIFGCDIVISFPRPTIGG